MPVILRPEDEINQTPTRSDPMRDRADLREGVQIAVRTALLWLALVSVGLWFLLHGMEDAFIAADKLLKAGKEHQREACMPALVFMAFGLCFGCLIAWRMSSAASISGSATWMIGIVTIILLTFVGIVAANFIFQQSIPNICLISLGLMIPGALAGIAVVTNWLG